MSKKMMNMMITKTYNELITFDNFNDRLEYLRTASKIGVDTFGADRIFNQMFYNSEEWRSVRNKVITRDNGCDLGIQGCPINDEYDNVKKRRKSIIVHHIMPISMEDLINKSDKLFDMNNLITCSLRTHNIIHYGTKEQKEYREREKNDTCPWKVGVK